MSNIEAARPGGFDIPGSKVMRLNYNDAGRKTGASILLKVMATDTVTLGVETYWRYFASSSRSYSVILKKVHMANEIFLDFCIWNFDDITHQELTQILGIIPIKIYVKGKPTNPKLPQYISKVNGWRMGSGLSKQSSFEEQMDEMLRVIEEKIGLFQTICQKYYTEFSCAIYHYQSSEESFPSVHLNSRYNRLIKELNIEFDLDVYILP